MNQGLRYLLWREPLGQLRRLRRRTFGASGLLKLAGLALFLAFAVVPHLFNFMNGDSGVDSSTRFEAVATWGPYVLLIPMVTFGFGVGAVFFRPVEVDLLFPAPIGRRQLLLFNLVTRWRVQFASGLFASIFVLRWSRHSYGAVVGVVLFLFFLQVLAQLSGVFFATLEARSARVLRRYLPLLFVGAFVGVVLAARGTLEGEVGPMSEVLRRVIDFPVIAPLGMITRPFIEIFLAEDLAALLRASLIASGMIGCAVGALFIGDVAYSESAIATTRAMQRRLQRIRGGAGGGSGAAPSKAYFSLPAPPRFGGAGPIAWKQMLEMLRNPRALLGFGTMITIMIVVIVSLGGAGAGRHDPLLAKILVPQVIYVSAMMSLPFDFRRDTDRLGYLKSLPIGTLAVALGQSLPATLLLTVVQILIFAVLPQFVGGIDPIFYGYLPALACLNWNTASLDNALFLWMPYRMAPKDPGQFQFMGKTMFVLFVKMLLLGAIGACAFGLIIVLRTAVALPHALVSMMTCVFLFGTGLALTGLVARLYERFDVTKDLPA